MLNTKSNMLTHLWEVQKKRGKGDPDYCSQLQKNCVQNILIWLSGRAVKAQLQIVLIRLFAVTDGYPISVKNDIFLKKK